MFLFVISSKAKNVIALFPKLTFCFQERQGKQKKVQANGIYGHSTFLIICVKFQIFRMAHRENTIYYLVGGEPTHFQKKRSIQHYAFLGPIRNL